MGSDDYLDDYYTTDDPEDTGDDYGIYDDVARRARRHAEDVLYDFEEHEFDDGEGANDPAPLRSRLARIVRTLGLVAALAGAGVAILLLRDMLPGTAPAADAPVSGLDSPPATWPADIESQAHTVPALIKDMLTLAGEARGYQFDGAAGATWRITVEPRADSALDPLITLYAPSGAELARADDRSASDLTAEMVITLPDSGAYHLLVQSSQGGLTTGDYLLSLWPE